MATETVQTRKNTADAKYDLLKFLLSLFVVAIHSEVFPLILYPWLRMAVPLFFILSSYFLFSRLNRAEDSQAPGILAAFALRNIKLYAFWFTVLLPITLYAKKELYFAPTGIFYFLRDLLLGGTFYASWYIAALVIGMYLVWYLCRKLGSCPVLIAVLGVFSLLTLWSSYPQLLKSNPILAGLTRRYVDWFGEPIWSFPASLVWIYAGKCFAEGTFSLSSRLRFPLLLVSAIGLYLEWLLVRKLNGTFANDSYFFLLPFCVLFFACLQQLPHLTLSWASFLRRSSTVIYTVHYSAIHILWDWFHFPRQETSAPLCFFLAAALSLAVLLAIEGLLRVCRNARLKDLLRWAY